MKVLILSPYPQEIIKILEKNQDNYLIYNEKLKISFLKKNKIEFIISYGYKYLITKDIIDIFKGKIINLHISFLPFNRGYYPNLWSHLEGSPSGVTIHLINEQIDGGEILVQKQVEIDPKKHSFRSSYLILRKEIEILLESNWKFLKLGEIPGKISINKGSYKNKKDGDEILQLFDEGWDTKITKAIKIIKNYELKNS